MKTQYVMALDQGTTSCRAVLFDKRGKEYGMAQKEFKQIYPQPGWVEHDPMEIWDTQCRVMREAMKTSHVEAEDIAAIGITNQRETAVVWEKDTGRPIYNAIVWQSRQTAEICEELKRAGLEDYIKQNTGLLVDAYFSGTKIKWILDHVEGARERAQKGELLFGTVDTWLIWNLTRGVHVTEYSNASRTMLFNIKTLQWDQKLLDALDIPIQMMPSVKMSSEIYGYTHQNIFGKTQIPISGAAGDQQASLFGHGCFQPGMAKSTYGTGSFILMNTGEQIIHSENGLLTSICWGLDGTIQYALEGSIFIAGAVIQWLRDEMCIISSAQESEYYAQQVSDSNGVYFVPAFSGLGAPYWDMYARGIIVGLTRDTNRNHIVRAALESIAYQTKDVICEMAKDSNIDLARLKVDGGASANNFLMQFLSDILGVPIDRPANIETTALGAAYLAGLAVGFWKDKNDILANAEEGRTFANCLDGMQREKMYKGWQKAIRRSRDWEE